MAVSMNDLSELEEKQYSELKNELDESYLVKFCDFMEEAKAQLISVSETALGSEYAKKKDELERERANAARLSKSLFETDELKKLKDELVSLKEKLIYAPTEDEKNEIKSQMKGVLADITRINLNNFKTMSDEKKKIDALAAQLKDLVNEQKGKLEVVEKDVIEKAKINMRELMFSYEAEAEALAKAFGIDEFDRKPAFIDKINPEAKLMDFDKNTLMDALKKREKHEHEHHGAKVESEKTGCAFASGCDKASCGGCSSADKDQDDGEKSIYLSKLIDSNKN